MDGTSSLKAESTALAGKDGAGVSMDSKQATEAALAGKDGAGVLMASKQATKAIRRCHHSVYIVGKTAAEKRTIRRIHQRYNGIIETLGATREKELQYWAGDLQNGRWKRATQLSKNGDIKPYGSKEVVPNSIVVRFCDTGLLGIIRASSVKQKISCIPKGGVNTKGVPIMLKRMTGPLFQNADEGWVRAVYANGEQNWYRPHKLDDAVNYNDQNGRRRSPPTKFVPGVNEGAEYDVSSCKERADDTRVFVDAYQKMCESLDDNDPNSLEVAIESALPSCNIVNDVDRVKGLARASLIFDILTGNEKLGGTDEIKPRLIPEWEKAITLLEGQNAKKDGEEDGKEDGKEDGEEDGERVRCALGEEDEVSDLNESGTSKYIEYIQEYLCQLEMSKTSKAKLGSKSSASIAKNTIKPKKPPKICVRCNQNQARRHGGLCRKCIKEDGVIVNALCWNCKTRRPVHLRGRCILCISNGSKDDRKCSKCEKCPRRYADGLCYGCHRCEKKRKADMVTN